MTAGRALSVAVTATLLTLGMACTDDDTEPPTDAADVYPGIDLAAEVTDGWLVLVVTAGDEDIVVLEPGSDVTVEDGDDGTRWVWERPPATGGDAGGVQEETRHGRLVPAHTTVRLDAHPRRPIPEGRWEICTVLSSESEAGPPVRDDDPSLRLVGPLSAGANGVSLCGRVDAEATAEAGHTADG